MAKVAILEEFTGKVLKDDAATKVELRESKIARDAFAQAYGADCSQVTGDAKIFKEQVDALRTGEIAALLDNINYHDQVFTQRRELYSDYVSADTREQMDNFRIDLLKHLAGSIVVKEHRLRYQKEQFDRFVTSSRVPGLKSKSQSLREFARSYALLIETLTESSHNGKCPKIEANYDDYAEQTIKPLNATIFYYFFGANKAGRTWA